MTRSISCLYCMLNDNGDIHEHVMCDLFLHTFIVWVIFFALPYSLIKLALIVKS